MKTLFFILFLPILGYCQSDEFLDCGYLKDTFVYKDFTSVHRNYVGGCCTAACLKRLEDHYSGWRTPNEINPVSYYVNILYDSSCCKDTPSIAVVTETPSTTTGTTPVTTSTAVTIPTTTVVTSTIITNTQNQKLDCGWLEESNGGLCCTQRALDLLRLYDSKWRESDDIDYRTQTINVLEFNRACDIHCQPELDCGFLNSTFEYEDWKNVNKTYVGGCCTSDCLEWLDTNVSDWREKPVNWNSYFINAMYDQHCCNDTPSIVGTTETSTIIPFTTSPTNTISADEKLDCHWLRDPFNYQNGSSYKGSCCTQQCLYYLSWTNPLWVIGYGNFLSRMKLVDSLKVEGKCCVVCLSSINSQSTPSIDCGWLRDSFQFTNSDEVNKSYNGECCTSEALDLLGKNNFSLLGISQKDRGKYINYLIKNEKCADFTTTTTPPTTTAIPPTTTTENLNCSWLDKPFVYIYFSTIMYYDGKCCNQEAIEELNSMRRGDEWRSTTDLSDKYFYVKTLRGKNLCSEAISGLKGASGKSGSNGSGSNSEITSSSSTTPTTTKPATSESVSTLSSSTSTDSFECGALTNTHCCTPEITKCLTGEKADWLSYESTNEYKEELIGCHCTLSTTISTEIPTTSLNFNCSWLITPFNYTDFQTYPPNNFSYYGTCCSEKAINTLNKTELNWLLTSEGVPDQNKWYHLVNLLYCVEGACTDPPRWNNCSISSTLSSSSTSSQSTTSSKLTSSVQTTDFTRKSSDGETTETEVTSTPSLTSTLTTIATTKTTGNGNNNDETTTISTTIAGSTSETKTNTDVESSSETSTKYTTEETTETESTEAETTTSTPTAETTPSSTSTTISTATSSKQTSGIETSPTESTVSTSEGFTTASTSSMSSTPTTSPTSFSSGSTDITETTMIEQISSTTTGTGSSTDPTLTTTESTSSASTSSGQTAQSPPTTEVTGTTTSHTTSTAGTSGASTTSGTTGTTTGTTTRNQTSTLTSTTGSTPGTTTNTDGVYFRNTTSEIFPNCTRVTTELIYYINGTGLRNVTYDHNISGCSSTTPMTTPEQTTTYNWPTGGTTRILPSGEIILSESLIAYKNCTTVLKQLIFNPSTNQTRTETTTDEYGCKTSTTPLRTSTTPMTTPVTTPTQSTTAKTTTYNWPTGGTTKILPSGEIILSESLIAYKNCTTVLKQLIFNPSTNQTRTETTTDEYGCRTSSSTVTSSKFSTTPMTTTTSKTGTTASTSLKTTTYNWPTGGTTRTLPSGEIIVSESLIAYTNCTTILMQLIFNPSTNKTRTETTSDSEGCKSSSSSAYITTPMSGGSTTPSPSDATTTFQWPTGGTTRMLPSGEIIISESLIAYKNCTTILMQLIFNPRTNTTRTETTTDANGCKSTSTGPGSGSPGITSPMATPTTTEAPFTFPDSKTTQILPNGEIILSESLIAYPNCTTVLKQLIFNPATNTTRTKTSSDAHGCKATSTTKPSATAPGAIASSTPIPPTTTIRSSTTTPAASSTASPVTTTTSPPTTSTSRPRSTTAVPVTCPFPSNLNLINTNRPTPEEIKENYAVGERIIHICKKYYIQELSKQPLRIYQCGEDGKWIGTLQKCILEPGRTEL